MAGSDLDRAQTQGDLPPLPIRAIARGLSAVIARAPFLWPVLKTPVRGFWERAAGGWDDRIWSASSTCRCTPIRSPA